MTAGPGRADWRLARPGFLRSVRFRSSQFIALAPRYTIANVFALEGPFDLVRIVYANDLTDASWWLDGVCMAASATVNDGVNPVNEAGDPMPWTLATCSGEALGPAAPGATRRLEIPPAPFEGALGLAATDWMTLTSQDRTDPGGRLPLLFVRSTSASGGRFAAFGAGDYNTPDGWPAVDQGRVVRGFWQHGDHAATPGVMQPAEDSLVVPFGVQYYQRVRGVSVMTLGDSLTAGFSTIASGNSFGFQACAAVSTPALPVSHIASGWSGQTAAAFIRRGYGEFALFRPEIVVIETTSPNGLPRTPADFDGMFAGALAFADHVERYGAVAILKTAVPFHMDAETDRLRRGINQRVRAMGDSGQLLVLDADAAVTNGREPAQSQERFRPVGDAHLNDQGHAAIAQELIPLLGRVLGQ